MIVYGKPGCKLCEAAKDKLQRMDVWFEEVNIEDVLVVHQGWRDDGSCEVLAWYMLHETLPVIWYRDRCWGYPELMRELRRVTA